jgi:hypothetical protein
MYLEKFKNRLKYAHLKVNPNYKLFKLFEWLYKDLQDEFGKVYKTIQELRTYVDNQIDILNQKIANIVVGTVPKLARNMKECYSGSTQLSANTDYTINIDYPTNYNLATTVILGVSAIKTSGVYTMYDISAIAQKYSIELTSENIQVKLKTTETLGDLGFVSLLLTITSTEDFN